MFENRSHSRPKLQNVSINDVSDVAVTYERWDTGWHHLAFDQRLRSKCSDKQTKWGRSRHSRIDKENNEELTLLSSRACHLLVAVESSSNRKPVNNLDPILTND